MKISQISNSQDLTLTFSGELTLTNLQQAQSALVEVFHRHNAISIQIKEIEELDVSFFQLLCAAYKTAIDEKKTITISIHSNDYSQSLLEISGFMAKWESIWSHECKKQKPDYSQ